MACDKNDGKMLCSKNKFQPQIVFECFVILVTPAKAGVQLIKRCAQSAPSFVFDVLNSLLLDPRATAGNNITLKATPTSPPPPAYLRAD